VYRQTNIVKPYEHFFIQSIILLTSTLIVKLLCCLKNLLVVLIVIFVTIFNCVCFGINKVIVTLENYFVHALISFSLCGTKYRSEICMCFS